MGAQSRSLKATAIALLVAVVALLGIGLLAPLAHAAITTHHTLTSRTSDAPATDSSAVTTGTAGLRWLATSTAYSYDDTRHDALTRTEGATHPPSTPGSVAPTSGARPSPVALVVATEEAAGYSASKIDITESGLDHVFERHLADGALSAGKSVFYDNVTITRLIADAETAAPVTRANGNLAWTIDAGRAIGIDRATGAATSMYTVLTNSGGRLVTAFPGTP